MSILNSLLGFLKKNQSFNKEEAPESVCPNCWGKEEYGGQFYEAVKNNNFDVNHKNPDIGWVQDYANKHLLAIELKKEGNDLVCQKCKITYRPV